MQVLPVILMLSVMLSFGQHTFAQSSAFGTLTDENTVGRDTLSVEGQTLATYKKALADYVKLYSAYTKSYGPQRVALEKQVLAKAKDTMTAKLGAVQTFLTNLKGRSTDLNLMTESEISAYDANVAKYQKYAAEKNKSIGNVSSVSDLQAYSKELNLELLSSMQFSEVHLAKISVTRGRFLIEKLMVLAPIIQAQLNTSADVGGDVEDIQRTLDDSMLTLEGLKGTYTDIENYAAMGSIVKTSESDFMANTRAANAKMVNAYNGIMDVISRLRTLYAQAPWDEKLVEQLLEGPKTNESTQSSTENK